MREGEPRSGPSRVEIVPVGGARDEELLRWLAEALGERLGVPVGPGTPLEPRPEWRRAESGQLDSNRVVDALIARDAGEDSAEAPARWVLGVTGEDLVAPGLSFVFGEAAQGGSWAVIALPRLREGLRSGDPDAMLRRRVLKEAMHELGHLRGLGHCERRRCVMFPSESLDDTDRKSDVLCPACEARARGAAGVDPASPSR